MGAIDEKTGLTGLVTNVAETQAPPGTLIEAENVVVRRPGCIEPRDGLQLVQTLASGFAAYGFSWRTKDFILRNNGSNTFDWRDTSGTLYRYADYTAIGTIDPQPMRRDVFSRAEARANLYLPYEAGVLKMTSDAGPWRATGTLPGFIVGLTTVTGSWLGNNEQVAYRLVWTKKDANGLVVRSLPTGAEIVSNTTGSAKAVSVNPSPGGVLITPFAPDTLEVYRSRNFPTSVTPDEELRLVATLPASAGSFTDNVAPADMGSVIYTAPSRGGIAQQNERPPACACSALFRSSLFFANVRGPRRVKVSYNYTIGLTTATGIGRRNYTGDITSGNANILNLSSTAGLEKGMVITGAGIQVGATITNISGTTVTMSLPATATTVGVALAFFDSMRFDSGAWFAVSANLPANIVQRISTDFMSSYEVTPSESGYQNTAVVETTSRATTSRTIQATHGSEYSPALPNFDGTPQVMEQDVRPGAIYWSKPDEPEHVRSIDYVFVGEQNKAILGLVPTRDALFIIKEDGIFRLTGANGVWRVDPFDPTARCVLPGSVRALRGRGVFLGDRGVAIVSDEGVELASAAVNDLVKPIVDALVANWASTGFYELSGMAGANVACVFERESEYTLARSSTTPPLVYNDITGAWTTLAYYGHANESYSYKALFNFERTGSCVLSLGVSYFKTLLSTDAGADYLRNDRATAVTVNSYAAPNATLSAAINALEDDIIKDSAGRYWRITAAVNNSATVPVVLAGGSAALATGAATLYRSLRCSVVATGFTQPMSAQKRWGQFLTAWTKFVGPVRARYAFQSSEDPNANWAAEEDVRTTLSVSGGSGNGFANYLFGLAAPTQVPRASMRAWLLRARVRWAMAHGDTQLEGLSAELVPMELGSTQQVKA